MIDWKKYKIIDYQDFLEASDYVLRLQDVNPPQDKDEYMEYKRCICKILELLTYNDIEEAE